MTLQEAFRILKLAADADRAQIRRAYSEQAKLYHVETHPEEFTLLREAYETALAQLSKPKPAPAGKTAFPDSAPFSRKAAPRFLPPSGRQEASPEEETAAPETGASPYDDILNSLLESGFSVSEASEPIQLMYYKCRYEESSLEETAVPGIPNRETDAGGNPFRHMGSGGTGVWADAGPFFETPWSVWKTLDWTALICHPEFLKKQYDDRFLDELYWFVRQEETNGADGISQNLFFSLCTAYGFFCKEAAEPLPENENTRGNAPLEKIENLLFLHPRYVEYSQDLQSWASLKEARGIALFCRRAYSAAANAETSGAAAERFLLSAEEKLLHDGIPWKGFIFDSLCLLPGSLFSKELPERKKEYIKRLETQRSCFSDFSSLLLDHCSEGNSLYEYGYRPLAERIAKFKSLYFTREDWKKIVCSPVFVSSFKSRMEPRRGGFLSQCPLIEYVLWRELRSWFDGAAPLEKEMQEYLKTSFYFPEYEKWYRQERVWRERHIEQDCFNEVLPVPPLSPGKLELLRAAEQGTPVNVRGIQAVFNNLPGHNEKAFDFLTRVTNAMIHFKFLLVTPKYEKEPVPGDAFCFLENGVILYRKKENLTCRLTHQSFYDLISHHIEMIALNSGYSKTGYSEEFIGTVCRNLYCYECYISRLSGK